MEQHGQKKASLVKTGIILGVISYILWVPTFFFLTMAIGKKAWLWGRLAVITYGISWVFFISGFIVAGPDALRSGRRWILRIFRKKPPSNTAESAESHEEVNSNSQ